MKSVPPKNTSLARLLSIWSALLACAAGAEILVRAAPRPIVENHVELLIDHQRDKVDRIEDGAVLLLGDSSLGSDIDAAQLSWRLSMPIYNLALVGNDTTIGDWFLLERAIAAGKKIRAVVIMHTADLWGRPLDEDSYQLLERRFGKSGLETVAYGLSMRSALVQQSKAYKTLLLTEGAGLDPSDARLRAALQVPDAARQALAEIDYIPQAQRQPWERYEQNILEGKGNAKPLVDFRVDPHVERWFDDTLDLAARHAIPVYLASTPIWEKKALASRLYYEDMLAWFRMASRDRARFRWLYDFFPTTESSNLGDKYDHLLLSVKRDAFTPWFGERLARALRGEVDPLPSDEKHELFWDPFRNAPSDGH